MIINKLLNIISTKSVKLKLNNSKFAPVLKIFNAYIEVSNNRVAPADINIMVNLLSFEKFLSKYSPSKPIIPNNTELTPIKEPIDKSIISPNIIPKIPPTLFPTNNPRNKA